MSEADFAIAVFPYLKTSAPVVIGSHTFRSTVDVDALTESQRKAIDEIASMLFVHGNLRAKSASYTIVPGLQVHSADPRIAELRHLRDVVAYLYSAPHPVFDAVFLSPEEISLLLFTPGRVNVHLTRPEHHTVLVSQPAGAEPDKFGYLPGYNGLYNFRHHFWVEPGSRVYGPKPHMTLNISQDLCADLSERMAGRADCGLLSRLLRKSDTPASLRVFTALNWYNAANESGIDGGSSILNLAVAFETLLKLPESAKTERLVDAISLLLGRTERLDDWAEQFYNARSKVAHEGAISDLYFYAADPERRRIFDVFGSLMLYGRQIFQLCLSTLLVGMDLADRASLQEKLITNNERYQKICDLLKSGSSAESVGELRLG